MPPAALPFETTSRVRDACLCLHAQRAARSLARRFDEAFRPFGLTNGQFSLLLALNRPEPTPMAPVAGLLAVDRTTLTAALKPLAGRGLLEIVAPPGDRRTRLLRLTAEGHALLAAAVPVWEALHAAIEAGIGPHDADSLRGMLGALRGTPDGRSAGARPVDAAPPP